MKAPDRVCCDTPKNKKMSSEVEIVGIFEDLRTCTEKNVSLDIFSEGFCFPLLCEDAPLFGGRACQNFTHSVTEGFAIAGMWRVLD